ncbi:MAG TPA: hypothetical protein PKX91_05225 [Clostridia bacterium]|jgi:hypothetical protein|nr:hypothetical protein [Clostridia bacterium]
MRTIGNLIIGIIIGIVLVVGGVAAGFSILWTKEGSVGTTMDLVHNYYGEFPMNPGEDIRQLSLGSYVTEILNMVSNIGDVEVSHFEKVTGTDAVSKAIADIVGIEPEVVQPAKFSELGSTITDNLTVRVVQDKFEVTLPDMPVFRDAEFLDTSLSEAFGNLDNYPLDQFIVVVYDEDPEEAGERSPQLLQSLGKTAITELSNNFGEKLDDMTFGELITITEESNKILQYMKETKLKDLDTTMRTMKLSDAITINEDSHAVVRELADSTLDKLNDTEYVTGIVNSLKLSDFVKITEESDPILKALQDTSIGDLDTKIPSLTVSEVFRNPYSGVLCLIPDDTVLQDIPTALSDAVETASLYTLVATGVFTIDQPKVKSRNVIYNATVEDIVNAFANEKLPSEQVELVVLYENTLPYWATIAFGGSIFKKVDLIDLELKGYITKINKDITVSGETNTVEAWNITQATLSNLHKSADPLEPYAPAKHGTVFLPVGNINIVVEGDPSPEATENTFDRTFSFDFKAQDEASDKSKVLVGNNIKMVNDRGGYMVFAKVENHVFADTDADGVFTQLVPLINEPTIERNMVKKTGDEVSTPNILIEYDPTDE